MAGESNQRTLLGSGASIEKRSILVAGANDIYLVLAPRLRDRFDVARATDFSTARARFNEKHPALLVCGLDDNGRQFSPLFKMAARHNVPVLPVATTIEAMETVDEVKWAVNRRSLDAIRLCATKMLSDAGFVPNDPEKYPPPPRQKAEESNGGVKISQAQFLKPSAENSELDAHFDVEQLELQLDRRIKSAIGRAWDESTQHFITQAQNILTLQGQIASLDEYVKTVNKDLGEMINAVALEGVTLHNELKERVEALAARSSTIMTGLTERLDAMVTENSNAHKKLQENFTQSSPDLGVSDTDIDAYVGRLRASLEERTTQIEDLQSALSDMKNRGVARESDVRQQMDTVEKRFLSIEKSLDIMMKTGHAGGGSGASLVIVEAIEGRLDKLEANLTAMERNGTSGSNDLASQFEDIWGTQTTLTKLQKRLNTLEERVVSGPSVSASTSAAPHIPQGGFDDERVISIKETQELLFRRMEELDKRTAALESAVGNVARQSAEFSSRAPSDAVISTLDERVFSIEQTLKRLKEGATAMASIPDFTMQVEKTQETQENILKRLHFLEKISSSPPPSPRYASSTPPDKLGTRISDVESLFRGREAERDALNEEATLKVLREKPHRPYSYHIQNPGKDREPPQRSTDPVVTEPPHRPSAPQKKGAQTLISWSPEAGKKQDGESVKQRSIIKTSSDSPKSTIADGKPPHQSERETLVGQKASKTPSTPPDKTGGTSK